MTPHTVQHAATGFVGWARGDGPALVFIGAGAIARGVTYLPVLMGPRAAASHPAEGLLTMGQWAMVWIFIGALCLAGSVCERVSTLAVALGVGIHVLWGASFIADSIAERSPRGWLPAVGYISVAAFTMWSVWRGSREIIPEGAVANELRKP